MQHWHISPITEQYFSGGAYLLFRRDRRCASCSVDSVYLLHATFTTTASDTCVASTCRYYRTPFCFAATEPYRDRK